MGGAELELPAAQLGLRLTPDEQAGRAGEDGAGDPRTDDPRLDGSSTTGLPNATGDIGNWTEPLGLASLFIEGAVVAVATSAYAIVPPRRQVTSGVHSISRVMPNAA